MSSENDGYDGLRLSRLPSSDSRPSVEFRYRHRALAVSGSCGRQGVQIEPTVRSGRIDCGDPRQC